MGGMRIVRSSQAVHTLIGEGPPFRLAVASIHPGSETGENRTEPFASGGRGVVDTIACEVL